MNVTSTPKSTGPLDASVGRADDRLAHAHEQIMRAGEQLARLDEQVARMEREAAHPPSTGPGPQSAPGKPAIRARVGLPLSACILVAALVLYSGGAKLVVARWAPEPVSTPSLPAENLPLPKRLTPSIVEQPPPLIAQMAAAEAARPQATPPAQTAPQDVVPTATAPLPDQTQLLQAMARDLANMERNIEQLRANQQQIANDNSKAIAELKASQEEIKRVLAKVSEQNPPPKTSPPPTQPPPTLRRPERPLQPPQARARPRIPREWLYDDYW